MGEATQAAASLSPKVQQVLDLVSGMTLLESAELVKAFEQKFGVSAAPVAAAAVAAPAAGAAAAAEEKTDFDVILANAGPNKLQVIKVVREFTTLGLKEAKALVDTAPKPVKEAVGKEEAQKIKAKLEEVGAKVELK
jgi:large subunit ribosomal protein L7/L12